MRTRPLHGSRSRCGKNYVTNTSISYVILCGRSPCRSMWARCARALHARKPPETSRCCSLNDPNAACCCVVHRAHSNLSLTRGGRLTIMVRRSVRTWQNLRRITMNKEERTGLARASLVTSIPNSDSRSNRLSHMRPEHRCGADTHDSTTVRRSHSSHFSTLPHVKDRANAHGHVAV